MMTLKAPFWYCRENFFEELFKFAEKMFLKICFKLLKHLIYYYLIFLFACESEIGC